MGTATTLPVPELSNLPEIQTPRPDELRVADGRIATHLGGGTYQVLPGQEVEPDWHEGHDGDVESHGWRVNYNDDCRDG